MVGYDAVSGQSRYDFGVTELMGGLGLVPILVGAFVVSEIFMQIELMRSGKDPSVLVPHSSKPEDNKLSWPEFIRCFPTIIRSSGLGAAIGPDAGNRIRSGLLYCLRGGKTQSPPSRGVGQRSH